MLTDCFGSYCSTEFKLAFNDLIREVMSEDFSQVLQAVETLMIGHEEFLLRKQRDRLRPFASPDDVANASFRLI